MPVVAEGLPDAIIVHRRGEINAWDHADFVAAVKKTGRKKLLVDRKVNLNESTIRTLSTVSAEEDVVVILGVTARSSITSKEPNHEQWQCGRRS
jgi:hypothetical protein